MKILWIARITVLLMLIVSMIIGFVVVGHLLFAKIRTPIEKKQSQLDCIEQKVDYILLKLEPEKIEDVMPENVRIPK